MTHSGIFTLHEWIKVFTNLLTHYFLSHQRRSVAMTTKIENGIFTEVEKQTHMLSLKRQKGFRV